MQKVINLWDYRKKVIEQDKRKAWNKIQFFVNRLLAEMNEDGWEHYETTSNVETEYLMFFRKENE